MDYFYRTGDMIKEGDLITVDYQYEYCIVLKLLTNEQELKTWGWAEKPGPGVFAYSYRLRNINYYPIGILISDETQFLGRCPAPVFVNLDQMWTEGIMN